MKKQLLALIVLSLLATGCQENKNEGACLICEC